MNNALDGRSKYELTLLAKIAQQTERYEEMVTYADKLFLFDEELTSAERNLCSSAYKNVISNRRAELKVLESIQNKLTPKEYKEIRTTIEKYKKDIEEELKTICKRVIRLIEEKVIPAKVQIKSAEARVFYLKMRGDFYRYLCEIDDN